MYAASRTRPREPRIFGPCAATTQLIRQNTPIGETRRMKDMTVCVTSLNEEMNVAKGLPFSPATRTPQPNSSAMTMIWSIEASIIGCTELDGKMFLIVVMMSLSFASYAASSARDRTGKLPLKRFATTSPITQATAVVARKYTTVFQPILPTLPISPMENMPSMMESRTRGTTMNFRRLTKMSPKGLR